MNQDLDGDCPQGVEWTQQVTGRLSIEPVNDVPFTKHDERLQVRQARGQISQVREWFKSDDIFLLKRQTFCDW